MHSGTYKHGSGSCPRWSSLFLFLLLTSATLALAQPDRQQWTLVQCLERALEVSPEVHMALADIQIATSQLAQAKAGRLPRVTVTSLTGIVNGTDGDGFAARSDDGDLGPFFKGELEVIQPLYTFGRLRNEIRAASQGVATQQAASDKSRDAVIAAIKEFYYNLLFSRRIKALLAEVQENFTKALETAEERLEAQEDNITQQDVLKLRIGLAGVTKETLTLERAIAVTREALKRQLGLPPDASFDIADTRLKPVSLRLQPLVSYLEEAEQHRPELAQIEAGLAARQARLEAARSAYYPLLFLAGGVAGAIAPNRDNQKSPFANPDNS